MTYHYALLDFDDCAPARSEETAVKPLRSKSETTGPPSEEIVIADQEPPETKAWTAQEIALATFWVAG